MVAPWNAEYYRVSRDVNEAPWCSIFNLCVFYFPSQLIGQWHARSFLASMLAWRVSVWAHTYIACIPTWKTRSSSSIQWVEHNKNTLNYSRFHTLYFVLYIYIATRKVCTTACCCCSRRRNILLQQPISTNNIGRPWGCARQPAKHPPQNITLIFYKNRTSFLEQQYLINTWYYVN